MPLTRHYLAIPKAEANLKLNVLITRKSLHEKIDQADQVWKLNCRELRKR